MNVGLSDKSKQFLRSEWDIADQTIMILRENLAVLSPWPHQYLTSSGAYLGDIYKVVEKTLRMLIEEIEAKKLPQNDRWHQTLLEKSYEYCLIPEEHYITLRGMLRYRHLCVHGYAVKLDEEIIRQRAPEAIEAFYAFVNLIRTKFDIPCLKENQ